MDVIAILKDIERLSADIVARQKLLEKHVQEYKREGHYKAAQRSQVKADILEAANIGLIPIYKQLQGLNK